MTSDETKVAIREAIGSIVCPALAPAGFKRRGPKSKELTRRHGEFSQTLAFFWSRPRYGDDPSDAHIGPHVRLGHPELFRVQRLIAGDDNLVQGYPNHLFAGTIGLLGPKRSLVGWRPTGVDEINQSFRGILEYIDRWVLPYLEEISTLRDIVEGYEQGYTPLALGQVYELRIAAAYYALGEPDRALAALQAAVEGKLAFERRYRVPIEFLKAAAASKRERGSDG